MSIETTEAIKLYAVQRPAREGIRRDFDVALRPGVVMAGRLSVEPLGLEGETSSTIVYQDRERPLDRPYHARPGMTAIDDDETAIQTIARALL